MWNFLDVVILSFLTWTEISQMSPPRFYSFSVQLETLLVTMLATVQSEKVSEFRLLSQVGNKEQMLLIPPWHRSAVSMRWGEIYYGLKISFPIHIELNISK